MILHLLAYLNFWEKKMSAWIKKKPFFMFFFFLLFFSQGYLSSTETHFSSSLLPSIPPPVVSGGLWTGQWAQCAENVSILAGKGWLSPRKILLGLPCPTDAIWEVLGTSRKAEVLFFLFPPVLIARWGIRVSWRLWRLGGGVGVFIIYILSHTL